MTKHYKYLITLFAAALLWGACSDDEVDYGTSGIKMEVPAAADITSTSAVLSTVFNIRDDVRYTSAGFCYSKTATPTIYNSTVKGSVTNGILSATLEGLAPQTTYHVRAFAGVYQGDVVYSPEFSLTLAEGTLDEALAAYEAPAYADNYKNISAWTMRNQWNLANVHDPSVMLAEDGHYYMYQTDASYGNVHEYGGHFHARRSKDLVNWEYLGGTMLEIPAWVKEKLNEYRATMGLEAIAEPSYGYWAPVVRKVKDGLYRMYYSIVINNYIKTGAENTEANFDNSWTERAFIGLMETSDPASNEWTDKGMVVCSSSDKGMDWTRPALTDWNAYFKWNAIDPSYIITPEGAHWLIYGSWHSGIAAMELDAETGMPKQSLGVPWAEGNTPAEYGQIIATRGNSRWQASEGPEIIYNAETGYYYLFVAYDALAIPYNTRVCRSKSITGPYLGIDGANVTEGADMLPVVTHPYKFQNSDGWVGISHCAIFDDGNGNWYYASQARLPESIDNAIMMGHVRSIRWTKDGWPLVMPERYGAVPQATVTEEELIGNWEHIDLSYSYEVQKESVTMTLAADHTVTEGTWKGSTWSYDAENQILTVNGIDLYLQREVDWEASPRTHTIVYAAYGNNKTYWGKKIK